MNKISPSPEILKALDTIEFSYFTPDLPPPFSYEYSLVARLLNEELAITFSLRYTGREEIDEEDILAEGFTLNDDYTYEGTLPEVWAAVLKEKLQKSAWTKIEENQSLLLIKCSNAQGKSFKGSPADFGSWEYFLQEIMQAIFEAGKKELPLEVEFLEISLNSPSLSIQLSPSFLHRTFKVSYTKEGSPSPKTAMLPWKQVKKTLKTIFIPDYHPDLAADKKPVKPGKYIAPGDGYWYMLGKAVTNPGAELDSLALLEKRLKELV